MLHKRACPYKNLTVSMIMYFTVEQTNKNNKIVRIKAIMHNNEYVNVICTCLDNPFFI